METLLRHPRMMPYIPKVLVEGLEKILKSYTTDVTKQDFTMNQKSEYVFFTEQKPTEMTISVAKPFIFDVVLAIIIGIYLAGMYQLVKVI